MASIFQTATNADTLRLVGSCGALGGSRLIRDPTKRIPGMRQTLQPEVIDALAAHVDDKPQFTLIIPLAAFGKLVGSGDRRRTRKSTNAGNILGVLEGDTLKVADIVARLRDRGLLPGGTNPVQMVRKILGQRTDLFERIGRGLYRTNNTQNQETQP